MKSQKNTLATLSPQQSNPYTASPLDFEVVRDGEEHFHGQHSDKLLKQGNKRRSKPSPATEPSDAGKSHTP